MRRAVQNRYDDAVARHGEVEKPLLGLPGYYELLRPTRGLKHSPVAAASCSI